MSGVVALPGVCMPVMSFMPLSGMSGMPDLVAPLAEPDSAGTLPALGPPCPSRAYACQPPICPTRSFASRQDRIG